jgi:dUTPase
MFNDKPEITILKTRPATNMPTRVPHNNSAIYLHSSLRDIKYTHTHGKKNAPWYTYVEDNDHVVIPPSSRVLIPTGIILEAPKGYSIEIKSNNDRNFKHGLTLFNPPDVYEEGTSKELCFVAVNSTDFVLSIKDNDILGTTILRKNVDFSMNVETIY